MEEEERLRGTQFTCFAGAKVPPLPFTCFTGTKVQILRQHVGGGAASRYSVYLLYWYKSTNSDARRSAIYLLYWYKSTNSDAEGAQMLSGSALLGSLSGMKR